MIGYDYHVFEEGEVFLNGAGRVYRVTHVGKMIGAAGAVEAEQLSYNQRRGWYVTKESTLVRTADAVNLSPKLLEDFAASEPNPVPSTNLMRVIHAQLCGPYRAQHQAETLDRKREMQERRGLR